LNPRLVASVLSDCVARSRQRRLMLVRIALAASVLMAVAAYAFWPRSTNVDTSTPQNEPIMAERSVKPAPSVPSLRDSVAEAGSAVVSLTRRKADDTVEQTRLLLAMPMPDPALDGTSTLQETLDPPARSLREAGHGVTAGLEPVTNSARRAVNLFLRELPPMAGERNGGL